MSIHPTAIVHPDAQLDSEVVVGPYCTVGANVKIGRGTKLISHVVLDGHTTLGEFNEVFPFASVGTIPQDLKYKGEPTLLLIGDRNKIRECATLQPGTVQGGGKTVVGNNNLFMAYTHVAHDCIIGNDNIFANSVQLSGHVEIHNGVVVGGISGIHQFCRIGDMAMIAAGSIVVQDVPNYCVAQGDRATLRGMNIIGMRRRGLTATDLNVLKSLYKQFFLSPLPTVAETMEACREQGLLDNPHALRMAEFIASANRGVVRPAEGGNHDDLSATI
ncbi:MAG: acyl-ACP--UDP-N-acetylglucosamine O-acyltransferase [Proteobacteria bacterium]|nr:acyl-ACP--UDP-N-acetylglucosamine O-acyltransferase [Pseudomonadota bacterium]